MDLLERLLKHDSYTTFELLRCAATLDDEALDNEFDLGPKTVRMTLRHIVECHEGWLDVMQGKTPRWGELSRTISVEFLIQRHQAVTADLYDFARQVHDEDRLDDTFIDPDHRPPSHKTFGGCILHLATHAMHHRAQLLFMLRRLGLATLPEGDALGWERQHRGGWEPA